MNNPRRANLRSVIEQLEVLHEALEELAEEESECRDNMPENLWGSERYETSEQASGHMDDALSLLEEAMCSIESAIEC